MYHSFDVDVAKQYGILEAVLVAHFEFWIKKNEANGVNYHDGEFWTWNSTAAFQKLFPYASRRQIECALHHLRDEGILKVGNYNDLKVDRTLWYAFTEKGKCISQFGEMHSAENVNAFTPEGEPIPDIDSDIDTGINAGNRKAKAEWIDYESFQDVYNQFCTKLPECKSLTSKRKKDIQDFLKDFTPDQWREICEKANQSSFLTGSNDRKWKANIDFLLKIDKAAKILEGGYSKEEKKSGPPDDGLYYGVYV